MRRPSSLLRIGLAFAAVVTASTGAAARVAHAQTTATRADSVAEREALESTVRRNQRDAGAWHRKGMIAWGLAEGRRSAELQSPEVIHLTRDADTSLRIAVQEAPDSVRWALDLMRYVLTSHVSTARSAASVVARKAVAAAERLRNPLLIAETKDAVGMAVWRNYETFSHRPRPGERMVPLEHGLNENQTGEGVLLTARATAAAEEPMANAMGNPRYRSDLALEVSGDLAHDFGGETDYRVAERLFAEALAADPSSRAALRHYYMLLSERERWEELSHVSSMRIEVAPNDVVARLSLALAEHRLGDDAAAARDFERGFALLPSAERARLTSVTRLLSPRRMPGDSTTAPDSIAYAAAGPSRRAAIERKFWADADPLALTSVNEHRNEFYSRVIYSELLWSVDELGIRGSETGRGDIFIRYGQPLGILRDAEITTWMYPFRSINFATPAGFGVGYYIVPNDPNGAGEWRISLIPFRWYDPPASVPDSIAVEVARFRAGGDSSSIYVAARFPVRRLVEGIGRGSASVDVGFLLEDRDGQTILRDSSRLRIAAVDAAQGEVRAWQSAIDSGDYAFRVEGLGIANRVAARSRGRLIAPHVSGFGVSDVLIAAHVTPPATSTAATRWSDFATVPNAGLVRRGEPLSLLWETYGLRPAHDSTVAYRVRVAIEPAAGDPVSDFVARVIDGAADIIGRRSTAARGRLSVSYDRQAPARNAIPDYLAINLGAAPAGDYLLRVTVEEPTGRRSATSTARFTILP